jgi:hypothetical protein
MIIRRIKRSSLEKEPYKLWNAFVDILAMEKYEDLTAIQRTAHLCFWYDAEVQNGGHLQYFENRGTDLVQHTVLALVDIGAGCQARVLEAASRQYLSVDRRSIDTVEAFVEEALAGEFEQFDGDYHQCSPTIADLLETYLQAHQDSFVEIEDSPVPEGTPSEGFKSKLSELIARLGFKK